MLIGSINREGQIMWRRFFFACVMGVAVSSNMSAYGGWFGSGKGELQERIARQERLISTLKTENGELRERVERQESAISALKAQNDTLRSRSEETNEKDGPEEPAKRGRAVRWVLLLTAAVVCVILCFMFWPRKSNSGTTRHASSDKSRCPRCGWEHGPNDTICRNPNCKTQF